ncbi:Alpha/Beta hydrolase protein, partial [Plectosphaerella plurivora]
MASGKAPNYQYKHSKLGDLVGLARGANSEVVQFRGIPFASIPARFRQSVLAKGLPSQPFDARRPGPICPQRGHPFPTYWKGPPPAGYPCLPPPPEDEFGCLNLNITAPRIALEHQQKVPVLVFLHGGAFIGGSQSMQIAGREIYDGTNFVTYSINRNEPLIVITINYRLGALGFLASDELAGESRRNGEPVGNYGLHDQRQALEWIHQFIGGFGGDPGRVTVSGTSAGGGACHFLTTFPDRRFQRAIISSGTLLSVGPRPLSWHQGHFNCMKDILASGSSSPVEAIRTAPIADFLDALSIPLYNPLIDDKWICGGNMEAIMARSDDQPPPAILIGATEYERDLVMFILSDLTKPAPHVPKPDDEMLACAHDMISTSSMVPGALLEDFPFSAPPVAESYGLDRDQSPSNAFANWADLMADITFRVPPLQVASAMKDYRDRIGLSDAPPILVYEIRATNPYRDSPATYRRANHGANDVMLFNPAEDQVPPEHLSDWKGAVGQVQAAWLDFCCGRTPWEPFDGVEGTESDGFGPVFVFQDGPRGKLCRSLAEIDGYQTAVRWRALLEVAKDT